MFWDSGLNKLNASLQDFLPMQITTFPGRGTHGCCRRHLEGAEGRPVMGAAACGELLSNMSLWHVRRVLKGKQIISCVHIPDPAIRVTYCA